MASRLQIGKSGCWMLRSAEKEPFNTLVKQLDGRRWTATHSAWLLPAETTDLAALQLQFSNHYQVEIKVGESVEKLEPIGIQPNIEKPPTKIRPPPTLSKANQAALVLYQRQVTLKGYSPATLKTYSSEFRQFLETLKGVPAKDLSARLKDYLYYCHTILKMSEAHIHSRMNALKFYYEQVLGRVSFFFEIPRPKKQLQLPKVISEEKILEGIDELKNLKHKAIIMTAYSAGLRVSEVVALKVYDIQSDRMQITIRQAKGKKDRMVPLSKVLLETLRTYYLVYKPKDWLFEGQPAENPLSKRTAQAIFNQIFKKMNLPGGISFHSLRHSYATHLVENGIDVTFVQQLMGHNDVRTTLRYTHVSQAKINQVESPLDRAIRKREESKK